MSQKKRLFLKHTGSAIRFVPHKNTIPMFKSRFLSETHKISLKNKNTSLKKQRVSWHNAQVVESTAELLRNALLKRFVARRIRDLRKSAMQRKHKPRNKPFWIARKHDKKIWKAARYKLYNIPRSYGYARSITRGWAFSEFSLRIACRQKRQRLQATVFGEVLDGNRLSYKRFEAMRYRTSRFRAGFQKASSRKLVGRRLKQYMFTKRKNRKLKKTTFIQHHAARHRRQERFVKPLYKAVSYKAIQARFNAAAKIVKAVPRSTSFRLQTKMLLTPLYFQKNTTQLFVSAEEKERRRLYIQTTRQRRYRRLTETSEALTAVYTQLISCLIRTKRLKQVVSRADVSHLVHSIYWNLRIYLRHNFYNKKSGLYDVFAHALTVLKKETSISAKERFFDLQALTAARYRYQPHSLHAAPLLKRGAEAWLRQFLPVFYELYMEDAENYNHLNLTPIKVFRAHINRKAVHNWKTQRIPGLMENQFARLTTSRFEKNSSRFENMLTTTRRTPVFGGYGAAANLRIVNPAGSYVLHRSFFKREFTTTSQVPSKTFRKIGNPALLRRMQLLHRHTLTEKLLLSATSALKAHRLLKEAGVVRAKSHEFFSSDDTGVGSIDLRLNRAKSPRSGEYLQRHLKSKTSFEQFGLVPKLSLSRSKTLSPVESSLYRDTRSKMRTSLCASIPTKRSFSKESASITLAERAITAVRRTPFFLQTLQNSAQPIFPVYKYRTVYGGEKQKFGRRLETSRATDQRFLITNEAKVHRSRKEVTTAHSLLHFRSAALRTQFLYCYQAPVVAQQGPQLHRALRKKLWTYRFNRSVSARIRTSTRIKKRELKRKIKAFVLKKNRTSKSSKSLRICFPSNKLSSLNLKRFLRPTLNTPRHVNLLGGVFSTHHPLKKRSYKLLRGRNTRARRVSSYFKTNVKYSRANKIALSRTLVAIEKQTALTPLNTNRPRLWGKLTLRWMKKRRLMKSWLREVKYGFKQRVWRSRRNIQALPEELFKLARIRLRKLDWRESDERFYRGGLNQAFTFHPRERRNAPWLESLLYRRALYSYCRGEYRRAQFPREYKVNKWIQKLRKLLYRRKLVNTYVKRRRWPTLRLYNQRLGRSLFNIRTSKAVLKRFRQRARRSTKTSGLEHLLTGFGDRFDVNLMLLGIAPTVFWAREIAPMGLLRVNGRLIRKASFRFKPGDYVEWVWDKLQKVKVHFASLLKKRTVSKILKKSSFSFPGNFEYCAKLRSARYLRLPRPGDLSASGRLNEYLFLHFRLDSGLGK
jgi:ribosomal protein S4